MGLQLVGFLGGGVQGKRVIYIVAGRERQAAVGAIDRTGGGIDQVAGAVAAAQLQNAVKAVDVGADVGIGVLQRPVTVSPATSNRRTRCAPIKPATPVTNTFIGRNS